MTRRELFLLATSGLVTGPEAEASEPQNLSYPLRMIEGAVTPPNLLFVRDHFNPPNVSLRSWKLRIEGRVERPYELDFADLVEMPSRQVEAVLECAGNAPNGAAVSNGLWEGVPISALLERAKPAADAAFVLLEGADTGTLFPDRSSLPYSQIVPIAKCREASSLIAFKYNDLTLPARNGFPARAIFPNWYGMDSVKWLRRIVLLGPDEQGTAFERSGMNRLYNRVTASQSTRLSAIQVKSAIAWPPDGVKLPAAQYAVWGFAWSGMGPVRNLEISVNGGQTWGAATLRRPSIAQNWTRWTYTWDAKQGDYALMSRATDASGNQQPLQRDPARKDAYELNWCLPIRCSVR